MGKTLKVSGIERAENTFTITDFWGGLLILR